MPGERDKIDYKTSLSNLLINIVKQAQADGIITADEGELINRIQIDARDFEQEAAKALKEGSSTLTNVKSRMVERAREIAKKDGVITEDEEAIINKLIKELENVNL